MPLQQRCRYVWQGGRQTQLIAFKSDVVINRNDLKSM
jgi:hypothetical protein